MKSKLIISIRLDALKFLSCPVCFICSIFVMNNSSISTLLFWQIDYEITSFLKIRNCFISIHLPVQADQNFPAVHTQIFLIHNDSTQTLQPVYDPWLYGASDHRSGMDNRGRGESLKEGENYMLLKNNKFLQLLNSPTEQKTPLKLLKYYCFLQNFLIYICIRKKFQKL